jgi:hypothetical protein
VKGSDQCPKCASRKWAEAEQGITTFYAPLIRVCGNCGTAWEPFEPEQLLDVDLPRTSSFLEPCDNCAFRPGSPEQANTDVWKETIAAIKAGGSFYCHKGVPLTPGSEHGFDYPEGGANPRKLRLCRGYLNVFGAQMEKAMAK